MSFIKERCFNLCWKVTYRPLLTVIWQLTLHWRSRISVAWLYTVLFSWSQSETCKRLFFPSPSLTQWRGAILATGHLGFSPQAPCCFHCSTVWLWGRTMNYIYQPTAINCRAAWPQTTTSEAILRLHLWVLLKALESLRVPLWKREVTQDEWQAWSNGKGEPTEI